MTKTTWGEPIKTNGVKPAWLRDDDVWQWSISHTDHFIDANFTASKYDAADQYRFIARVRLPADHPAYIILAAGEPLWDGRTGWMPWHGGERAPDDWDGGHQMARNGDVDKYVEWRHPWRGGVGTTEFDIIAYRPTQQASTGSVPNAVSTQWYDPGEYPYAHTRDDAIKLLTDAGYKIEPPDPLAPAREALAQAMEAVGNPYSANIYRSKGNEVVVQAIADRFTLKADT